MTRHRLHRTGGLDVCILELGGYLRSLEVPLGDGERRQVALGYRDDADYARDAVHLGAIVGRCANRIRGARFELDGREYELPENVPGAHLHGGPEGYHRRSWRPTGPRADDEPLVLTLDDPDGAMGYPGAVSVRATFELSAPLTLRLTLEARSDAPTPVNLTWHPYLNLAGHDAGRLGEHRLRVDAEHWLPMAEDCCPDGSIAHVRRTPFDLREPTLLETVLGSDHPQVRQAGGIDHCLLPQGNGLRPVAELTAPEAELSVELWSTQPGLQVYSSNTLPRGGGDLAYLDGASYGRHAGLCLEPQGLPNAVNEPDFPDVVLRPGAFYRQMLEYRFRT